MYKKIKMQYNMSLKKLLIILVILIGILLIVFSFRTDTKERLTTSGINSKFVFDTSRSFEDYIEYSRKLVTAGRADINPLLDRDEIISLNSPYILYPNSKKCSNQEKKGALLIHGLT